MRFPPEHARPFQHHSKARPLPRTSHVRIPPWRSLPYHNSHRRNDNMHTPWPNTAELYSTLCNISVASKLPAFASTPVPTSLHLVKTHAILTLNSQPPEHHPHSNISPSHVPRHQTTVPVLHPPSQILPPGASRFSLCPRAHAPPSPSRNAIPNRARSSPRRIKHGLLANKLKGARRRSLAVRGCLGADVRFAMA
jgi:hypothetical protein